MKMPGRIQRQTWPSAWRSIHTVSTESAATIHVVDAEYDEGPVMARLAVPVLPGDTAADLEARVTSREPGFFVETLRRIADGDLALPGAG